MSSQNLCETDPLSTQEGLKRIKKAIVVVAMRTRNKIKYVKCAQ